MPLQLSWQSTTLLMLGSRVRAPEGVQKRRTKVLLFFLFLSGTIGGRAQAPPRNIGGDVMRINSPRHRLYCICLRQYATKQNTISLSGIELSEGCADRMVIYCSTFGLRFVLQVSALRLKPFEPLRGYKGRKSQRFPSFFRINTLGLAVFRGGIR